MAGYLFGGNTGETAESLARKRAVAEALLANANSRVPQSIGEGISAIGQALSGRLGLNALQKRQEAGSAALDAKIKSYWGGGDSSLPAPGAAAELGATSPAPVDLSDNQIYNDFIGTVKEGGVTNPFGLAAVAATGRAESAYSPANANRSWSDPSQSGQPGTAGGIMSWRGPRLKALYDFAQTRGEQPGAISPKTQAAFFIQEDPKLVAALNGAKSVEEAQQLMNRAWAFAGYDQPGGETARRLGYAKSFLPTFQGQGGGMQVASLEPSAGMAQTAPQAIDAAAAPSGYVDPQVTTDYRKPSPAVVAALGSGNSAAPAPSSPVAAALAGQPGTTGTPLPPLPSREVAPAPNVAAVPEQRNTLVAQALTGQQTPPPPPGRVDPRYLEILSDPYVTPGQAAMVRSMMEQDQQRQQTAYETWVKQNDPAYRLGIAKTEAELDNLRNPKLSPGEQATDAREREKMKFEREKFDAEMQKGQWQKLTDGRLYNQTTGEFRDAPPPAPGSVQPKFDDVSSLRKEIQQLPSYKNLSQALPIYRSMAETAGRNSKASDLNLVYGLGKIMDPTSVVREGEMVMVKNTASLPDWFQGAIASLNGGAALTPETREAIMKEAFGRVQGYDQPFKQDASQYSGIVERNKFNPADVIPDLGTYQPWNPNPDKTPAGDIPPAPEGVDPEDWKFLTPEQRRLWQN
ncbi:hypothetical protein HJA83_09980 [Rhizobium bangladeshense]|uniref:phage tail tip lysozyme n=1 Tax=Rhizobium bangladeshense TaxID=1138189 RepID=UPI001C82E757|nr:phage tail tip lysozyme [Rhizobium bangladeshense]MBX4901662.1 hypothetical protein [Rhizobium bangladeshense]